MSGPHRYDIVIRGKKGKVPTKLASELVAWLEDTDAVVTLDPEVQQLPPPEHHDGWLQGIHVDISFEEVPK